MRDTLLRATVAVLALALPLLLCAAQPVSAADAVAPQTQESFVGIGAEVKVEGGAVVIVRALDGGPAAIAGLQPGDRITRIDGQEVAGLSLTNAVARLRGPVGTTVAVTVLRGDQAPFDMSLTRDVIKMAASGTEPRKNADGTALVAFNADGFAPPPVQGMTQKETGTVDASPYLDGEETTVVSYATTDGAEQAFVLTTNGTPWGIHHEGGADPERVMLRSPTCNGTFSERMSKGHERGAPVCAVAAGGGAKVAFDEAGFAPPSIDGLEKQAGTLNADAATEIDGQETAIEVYADGKGRFVYLIRTSGVLWGVGAETGDRSPQTTYVLRDPDCSGRFAERVPFDGDAVQAPICAIVAGQPAPQATAPAEESTRAAGQTAGRKSGVQPPAAQAGDGSGVALGLGEGMAPPYGWSVVAAGGDPKSPLASSETDSAAPLDVPPGTYDVYWTQTYDHRDHPLLLAAGLKVEAGETATVRTDSGIRLESANWVPARDSTYGWWGAAPAGGSGKDPVNWTRADASLLLPPGRYDVYWVQTYDHRDDPLLLAAGVVVEPGRTTALKADSGLRIDVGDWVPARDSTYGWWGAVPAGGDFRDSVNWTKADSVLLLSPGKYDVYWVQTYDHRDDAIRLAAGVDIAAGQVATIPADSGIRIEVADWVPPRDDTYGWWGAAPAGGEAREPLNWSRVDAALLLVPGSYDVYWMQDYDHRDAPLRLAAGVAVAPGQVAAVTLDSGVALKLPADTPALDATYGWWGISPAGAGPDSTPLIFSKGRFDRPLPVPPGTYDVLWKQDYDSKAKLIAQGVAVAAGKLVEVAAKP